MEKGARPGRASSPAACGWVASWLPVKRPPYPAEAPRASRSTNYRSRRPDVYVVLPLLAVSSASSFKDKRISLRLALS